ncbi:unnamed protein product [Dovyalis caffra]|uniref:Uncharacterized protein n=1 Tax=Dovyalis caffra TaxID=77055 RepID=A0AAV1RRU9_9ROSI|nr:unnamed protein product [Dovyalis caffra]
MSFGCARCDESVGYSVKCEKPYGLLDVDSKIEKGDTPFVRLWFVTRTESGSSSTTGYYPYRYALFQKRIINDASRPICGNDVESTRMS